MSGRTIAIGDVHGDLEALDRLLKRLPKLDPGDTIVFLGDYLDRGPRSAEVVARVRELSALGPAKVVALRGNHEDAWLRIIDEGWFEFLIPRGNGCLETLRSFQGRAGKGGKAESDAPDADDFGAMERGGFFPPDVVTWMRGLPLFYEDSHAIYVHAGLKRQDGAFLHPSQVTPPRALLWLRDRDFFENYRGKLIVFGHTTTKYLPPELSTFTPDDPNDMWAGPACVGLDTGCGKGGFLTALMLPDKLVYESR
jgi:serine/threonine protein phosphatase 1